MTEPMTITEEQIWTWLHEVPDPEIPVISITDLGIVRDVALAGQGEGDCTITLTPTYSGCPATEVIAAQIRETLAAHGLRKVKLHTQLAPPWTTDWLSEAGRERLREYGIAPPSGAALSLTQISIPAKSEAVPCPICGSEATELLSQYGSTPCKSLYRCTACREPFDHFKAH